MIQKFRWQFIALSITSVFIVLFVSLGSLVAINFYRDSNEVNRVLTTLSTNNGNLSQKLTTDDENNFISGRENPEANSQYRYFSVLVNKNNHIIVTNRPKDFSLTNTQIINKVKPFTNNKRFKQGKIELNYNEYAYRGSVDHYGRKNIVFLNTTLIYAHSWTLLRLAIILDISSLILFAIILIVLSGNAVQPITEAYQKQQQFITNAGHELKTPLAIISANTEMEEMLGNESEWTKSTKQQTERLTKLINHLISLARMGETGEIALEKVDFSELTTKVSNSFTSIMKHKDLKFEQNIQPNIQVIAEEKTLTELVNIFLDNAQKYCDDHGTVSIALRKNKRNSYANLVISNTYVAGKNINYRNFFDRFYREDESHNNEKSGFGIGLSMAQDLVHAFKGKIKVHYHENTISFMIILRLAK